MVADRLARVAFRAGPVHQQGKSRRRSQPKNLLLSLPVEGNWPRSYPLQRYMNLNGQEELQ